MVVHVSHSERAEIRFNKKVSLTLKMNCWILFQDHPSSPAITVPVITSLHVFFRVNEIFVIYFWSSEPRNQPKECNSAQKLIFSHGVSLFRGLEKQKLAQITIMTPGKPLEGWEDALIMFHVVRSSHNLRRNKPQNSNAGGLTKHVTLTLPNMGIWCHH